MIHNKRQWGVIVIETIEELAANLTEWTWQSCMGMDFENYLFLNDSISKNADQFYSVVLRVQNDSYKEIVRLSTQSKDYDTTFRDIGKIIDGTFDNTRLAERV